MYRFRFAWPLMRSADSVSYTHLDVYKRQIDYGAKRTGLADVYKRQAESDDAKQVARNLAQSLKYTL